MRKNHKKMVQIFNEEIAYNGVSVIVFRRDCIQVLAKQKKIKSVSLK
jgi:indolepyruvate ferredoxin oxidoreductase alpha subunit